MSSRIQAGIMAKDLPAKSDPAHDSGVMTSNYPGKGAAPNVTIVVLAIAALAACLLLVHLYRITHWPDAGGTRRAWPNAGASRSAEPRMDSRAAGTINPA